MNGREIKKIPRQDTEKKRREDKRTKLGMLRILIEEMPDDARRLVKELTGAVV